MALSRKTREMCITNFGIFPADEKFCFYHKYAVFVHFKINCPDTFSTMKF